MSSRFQERTEAELRRGVLQLAVLALVRDEASYGYDLLRVLGEAGMRSEEGTLYPILRRLEKEGLLGSTWDTSGTRPRKYYRTTDRGRDVLAALIADWRGVTRALESVLAIGESRGSGARGGESDADQEPEQGSA